MRVLVFSDHHAHSWQPYRQETSSGMNSRLLDGINILRQIRKLAKDQQVGLILFGGDLFHARGSIVVQTFNAVFEEIAKMAVDCTVGLLVGNHDQQNRVGNVHSTYAMGSIVTVMDKPGWYQFNMKRDRSKNKPTLHVFALPYHPIKNDLLMEISAGVKIHPGKLQTTMMLGHFGVDGAEAGSNFVLVDKTILSVGELQCHEFDEVFLGHYHESQKLAPNARFIGATHHHNWGDAGSNRGCWIWDTGEKDQYAAPTFFGLSSPRFVTVNLNDLITMPWPEVQDSFVRVKHNGVSCADQEKAEQQLVKVGARKVEWVQENQSGGPQSVITSFHPGMDHEEMVESYVDEVGVGHPQLDDRYLIDMGREIMKKAAK